MFSPSQKAKVVKATKDLNDMDYSWDNGAGSYTVSMDKNCRDNMIGEGVVISCCHCCKKKMNQESSQTGGDMSFIPSE